VLLSQPLFELLVRLIVPDILVALSSSSSVTSVSLMLICLRSPSGIYMYERSTFRLSSIGCRTLLSLSYTFSVHCSNLSFLHLITWPCNAPQLMCWWHCIDRFAFDFDWNTLLTRLSFSILFFIPSYLIFCAFGVGFERTKTFFFVQIIQSNNC